MSIFVKDIEGLGMKWAKPFGDNFSCKSESMVQIRNLFEYRKEVRDDLLAWVETVIKKWKDDNLPHGVIHSGYQSYRNSFRLSTSGEIAFLYVAVAQE